jgi:hypothetical protein
VEMDLMQQAKAKDSDGDPEQSERSAFVMKNKRNRFLVPILAKSSSGDRHLAELGMTGWGTGFLTFSFYAAARLH